MQIPTPPNPALSAFAEAFAAEVPSASFVEVKIHEPGSDEYPHRRAEPGTVKVTVEARFPDGRKFAGYESGVATDEDGRPPVELMRILGRAFGKTCAAEASPGTPRIEP